MGLCQSEEERKQAAESHEIDKQLQAAKNAEKRIIKLLLLGTAECGKSTLIKQMRILHSNGFNEDEMAQRRHIVYANTLCAMEELLKAMRTYKVNFKDPARYLDARLVMDTLRKEGQENEPFSKELAAALKRLWADQALYTEIYAMRHEFHLHESAKHFLDALDRISAPNYRPTDTDILLSRYATTGIVEVEFVIQKVQFRVFDVGGQRSERKKWIHCFENVNAIIYIVAASEYDQVLWEDSRTNRLIESMRLFESICSSRWFVNTSIVLFLNKKDLFAEKIRNIPLRVCFHEYAGPANYDDCMTYITRKFDSLYGTEQKTEDGRQKTLFIHQTCATDTNQVQLILESVISVIIHNHLRNSGL